MDSERIKVKAEDVGRVGVELAGRIGTLEGRVHKENTKAGDADREVRSEVGKVRMELEMLQAALAQQQHQTPLPASGSDEEARAKLRALEERVGTVEGGVKDALEQVKTASSSSSWWSKKSSSNIIIKSTDGRDISSLISSLVDSAVATYSKDYLARADFALHSGGARVIPSLTSPTFEVRPHGVRANLVSMLTGGHGYAIGKPPVTALHHELHVGECWPFAGSTGQLGVVLAAPTYIEDITIDHAAQEVAFDIRSAPREMEVWGMVEGKDNMAKVEAWRAERARRRAEGEDVSGEDEEEYPKTLPKNPEYIRIASFSYNILAPGHIQTFPVDREVRELGVDFGIVVLRVKNNWGRDDFTCLYRMRVHGQRMGETPLYYSEEVFA